MHPAPRRLGGEQDPGPGIADEAAQPRRGIPGAVVGGQFRQGASCEIHAVAAACRAGIDPHAPVASDAVVEIPGPHVEGVGRKNRALHVMALRLVSPCDFGQVGFCGRVDVRLEYEHGVGRQVVEQRRGILVEQRQVVLDPLGRQSRTDVLVDVAATHIGIEGAVPGGSEAGDAGRVDGHFPRRQDADTVGLGDGSLGIGIEQPEAVDLVVEEVDANRVRTTHREDVDQRTADGELAPFGHRVDGPVAGACQALPLGGDVEGLADGDDQRLAVHETRRREALQQGGDRHDQDAAFGAGQLVERFQTFGDDVLMGREMIVGEGFPVRKGQNGYPARREEAYLAQRVKRGLRVRRDVDDEVFRVVGEPGGHQGTTTAVESLPVVHEVWRRGLGRRRRSHGAMLSPTAS